MALDVVRYADAFAIHLTQPRDAFRIEGFELKLSRSEFLRELRSPEKSGPLKLFCWAWWFVVLAPWKSTLLSLLELPVGGGLIELGTGGARIVKEADVREAEQPVPAFIKAFIRRQQEQRFEARLHEAPVGVEAPLSRVTRWISPMMAGLICGHVVPVAQFKTRDRPIALPCHDCVAGLPSDRLLLEAMISDADGPELASIRALVAKREAQIASKCNCLVRGGSPIHCAQDRLREDGRSEDDAAWGAEDAPCRCACHGTKGGAA